MMIEMTLDHVGPMCNSTEGVARMLSVLAGPDPLDPRQRGVIPNDYEHDYAPALERGVAGMRIGVVKEGFAQAPWQDLGLPASETVVDQKVMAAVRRLESLGAEVAEVSIPMHLMGPYIFRGIIAEGAAQFMIKENGAGTNWTGFYNTTLSEAFARGWRARPKSLPPGMVALVLTGEYLQRYYHGRYYAKAQNVRQRLVAAYDEALHDHDLLAMPTIPFRAPPIPPPDCSIEELLSATGAMYANTCQADVTGHPAMSIPCGMAEGLPIGMMLTGRRFDDASVIAASQAFESLGDWKHM
jgi:amidase